MTGNPPQVFIQVDEVIQDERLTLAMRQEIYTKLELKDDQVREIEEMVRKSPARDVAKAALRNVRAALPSKKNGGLRIVESHTCELAFAYELELDPDVLGYYTQVHCAGIERERNDRRHISSATFDFLVFRRSSIELVECKFEDWLVKEVENAGSDFRRTATGWAHKPFESRAVGLGLNFHVWTQTTPFGVHLQNQECCYALFGEPLTPHENAICKSVQRLLKEQPYSVEILNALLPEFNERLVLWMLAHRWAYGLVRSSSPLIRESFHLFAKQSHAEAADASLFAQMQAGFQQPVINDPLLSASVIDIENAENRKQRLEDIAAGKMPRTIRMTQLAKAVAQKVANGTSLLAACLTNYSSCGKNTESPLTLDQRAGLRHVIEKIWNKGKRNSIASLWLDLEEECKKKEAVPPSETTLARHIAREDPTIRALARGGMRSYHAVRPRSDGGKRSLPPLGYGYLLIIDSSGFDARCGQNLITLFPAEKPKFYLGIDGATGEGMAHSLIFGAARTDGLALLIREYVLRHGFLPRVIQVDRGPENTSKWLKEFCEKSGITLRHSPTGGSQFNGAAENAIKQVNTQVAHCVAGSSEPDMAGRKVDGRFKSRKTARHSFAQMHTEFIAFVYSDMPKKPDADGITPAEKREEILATIGCLGIPCAFDDQLLIKTSIRMDRALNYSERLGIRTGEGYFNSDELQRELRTKRIDEARSDCANPSILWVKIGHVWWKAFHRTSQALALMPDIKRLFELLFKPYANRSSRHAKRDIKRERKDRQTNAFEASEANSHLAPQSPIESEQPEDAPVVRRAVNWNAITTY